MDTPPIILYNRRTGCTEHEQVCGRKWMDLFYGTRVGRGLTRSLLCRPMISKIYGRIQNSALSRSKIQPFIEQFNVDLEEAHVPPQGFKSFNDFFIRALKSQARPLAADPQALISPADSRLQMFRIENETRLTVKGTALTLPQLLNTATLEPSFEGGLCLIFRLAPSDYHRFGYIDNGVQGPVQTIHGPLHSVNPLALKHKPDIHCTNFRQWCYQRSSQLGTVIQCEVGAMMVGSIVQHQPNGGYCRRGLEKGYFQFGGSTVIVIIEPDRVVMDEDIAHYSAQGIETQVRYGEQVGKIG